MKVENEEDIIKIYVPKEYKKITKDNFEEILRHILIKFNKCYKLNLSGFYTVDVYNDKIYGAIIIMKKEDVDYIDYDNNIDMRINFIDTEFLYQIDDYLYFSKLNYIDILFIEDKMYARINKNIKPKQLITLLEVTNEIKI